MVLIERSFDEIPTNIPKAPTGLFRISNEIMKICFPVIRNCSCKIVNKAVKDQTITDCFKIAEIFPLYKKVIQ